MIHLQIRCGGNIDTYEILTDNTSQNVGENI